MTSHNSVEITISFYNNIYFDSTIQPIRTNKDLDPEKRSSMMAKIMLSISLPIYHKNYIYTGPHYKSDEPLLFVFVF